MRACAYCGVADPTVGLYGTLPESYVPNDDFSVNVNANDFVIAHVTCAREAAKKKAELPKLFKYDAWVDISGTYRYPDIMAESYEDALEIAKDRAREDAGRGHLLDIHVVDCERQDAYE
jgi:hypothetical protein